MTMIKYLRLDLAARQLETAVWLFLEGRERFSAITLAGAASGILTQLVLNADKQPFADYGRLIMKERTGREPKRVEYTRRLNLLFGIDLLKHHAANDSPTFELDENWAAEDAIARALTDYVELCGQDAPFVKAFLHRVWVTRNGPEVMKAYGALPERMKRLKKR